MKNLKFLSIILLCAFSINAAYAQNTKAEKKAAKTANLKRIITEKKYVFNANYVVPMSMTPRALVGNYDVTVKSDSLNIYLPYFGRVYNAPRNPNEGGFRLVTTEFDQNVVAKKSGWEVTIKPKKPVTPGEKDIQSMVLSVSEDGYASLRVSSLSKQPISYNGTVEEVKKGK